MLDTLRDVWPEGSSPSLQEAADWVYNSLALNRIGIARMRQLFHESGMSVVWMVSLQDQDREMERLRLVSKESQILPEDLMVKGLSVLLKKSHSSCPGSA